MKQYMLRVNGAEPTGPLSESEMSLKLHEGYIDESDLCAETGTENWISVGEAMSSRKSVRLARRSAEEEAEMKAERSEKIDPDLRKKLLLYNLADAISVDKFTPDQAKAAVTIYETEYKKDKRRKIIISSLVGVATFVGVFCILNFVKLDGAPHRGLLSPIFALSSEPNKDYERHAKSTITAVKEFSDFREEINALEFRLPKGNETRDTFLQRVVIPDDKRIFITGSVDANTLCAALVNGGATPQVSVFRSERVNSDIMKDIQEEIELIEKLKTPLWDDEALQQAIATELLPHLPIRKDVPMSVSTYENRLKKTRVADIETEAEKWAKQLETVVNNYDRKSQMHTEGDLQTLRTRNVIEPKNKKGAQQQSQQPSPLPANARLSNMQKAHVVWALREMPAFLDRLNQFAIDNKINYSAEERKSVWNKFLETKGKAIDDEFGKYAENAEPIGPGGSFKIYATRENNLCAKIDLGDITLFVPAEMTAKEGTEKLVEFKDVKRNYMKAEDLLMDEKYVVVKKIILGNQPAFAEGRILKKRVRVIRFTPEINYIEVAKAEELGSKRPRTLTLIVPDKELFNSLSEGAAIPMKTLLPLKSVSRAVEPGLPGKLSPMSPEDAAKLKSQNEPDQKQEENEDEEDDEEEDSEKK